MEQSWGGLSLGSPREIKGLETSGFGAQEALSWTAAGWALGGPEKVQS